MSVEGSVRPRSAFCVVLGNEKGGSGKSTVAMHIAVALLKAGQRVATIDLDSRQKSFTHYIENRKAWAKHARLNLELPSHYCIERTEGAVEFAMRVRRRILELLTQTGHDRACSAAERDGLFELNVHETPKIDARELRHEHGKRPYVDPVPCSGTRVLAHIRECRWS